MNSFLSKALAAFFGLFLIVYVGYQSFVMFYNPYQTETVTLGDYVRDIDLNGFFVRDEALLDIQKSGVISYNYKNAQKISNGATIATVYENERDLLMLNRIDELNNQLEILKKAQDKDTIEGQKLDLLNTQIFSAKTDLISQVDQNDFSNISATSDLLTLLMNKVAVCIDNSLTFDSAISQLEGEINSLQLQIPTDVQTVATENSGYFSSATDGYENVFTNDILKDLSIEKVEEILDNPVKKETNSIGKLVGENTWKFVSLVPAKDIELLTKPYNDKATVKIRFNSVSTREIGAVIEQIITQKNEDMAVVVFSSSFIDEDIINMRFETPKLILGSQTGIIIPKSAIRLQDAVVDEETNEVSDKVMGVNILYGKTVKFKKVDVIYEDSYVVISRPNEKSSYVSIYDQVITNGKDINLPSPT